MPKRKQPTKADQAVALAEYAEKALAAAEQLRIKKKAVKQFPLDEDERAIAAELPGHTATLRIKLARTKTSFNVADVANMVLVVADSFLDADPKQQIVLLFIGQKLMACLQENIVMPKAKKVKSTAAVYQFKITLLESHPPIWRRIQIKDCSLDKLHEHIQSVMGWTNSHLHHFHLGEQLYGDPQLIRENFKEMAYKDSTTTTISDILPKTGKRFSFVYEYDFGDCWEHEVLFEGCPKSEAGRQYPICLEGERACPPDDVGGVGEYAEFLNTIKDKSHEERAEMLEWAGGWFDPEEFDPVVATKSMKKGIFDWRSERRMRNP